MSSRREGSAVGGARWVAGLVAIALATGGVAIWLSPRSEQSPDAALAPTWGDGAQQRYSLEVDSRVGLALPSDAGLAIQHMEQHLSGALHLRVFGRESGGIRVGFQLDRLDYLLAEQRNAGMEVGLGVPFVALFAPNGRLASFEFPEGLERSPRSLLEEVVRTFQLVQNGADSGALDARSWTTSEEHGMGRYLAYYERRPDGVVRKRKTMYTRVDMPFVFDSTAPGSRTESPEVQLRSSNASYRLAEGVAWVERGELSERAIFMSGGRRVGDTEVSARLELESMRPEEKLAVYAPGDWHDMLLAASDALRMLGQDPGALAGDIDLEDWLDALDAPTDERVRARAKLEEELVKRPHLASEVADAVRSDSDPKVAASLIHALERAGTPEAQHALVGLMEDEELERRRRLQSIIALGGVDAANEGAVYALLDMSRTRDGGDLATTALLAAGAAGETLREHGSSRASGLGEELHGSLRDAGDEQQVGVALKAMGNMADPEFADTVVPYVDHASPYVRASAAWALERTGASDQSLQLVERLAVEENGPVRAALVSALDELGAAPPGALEIVSESILNEPNPDVRYAMVQYLGSNLDSRPESRETLSFLALEDSSAVSRRVPDCSRPCSPSWGHRCSRLPTPRPRASQSRSTSARRTMGWADRRST